MGLEEDFTMSGSVIGKEIDGYRIQEVLGRGGMGIVYKAEDIALSRPVALKCLNQQLADDESFLRRFRSEARAIARINSPYIVQVYTLSEMEIGLVIVMEYVEGGTLKQRITPGETDWRELLPLIQQMLTALQDAHNAEVVHRDIKPQNILVSEIILAHGVRVKMTDFGLAKVNTSGDPTRTVTQGVYGTLLYMSPEQVEGHGQVDHRSDIYSIGMTCYEMLAGRLPFDEDSSEYTIMRTIVEGDLPELGAFASDVPDKLRDIIMKAVAQEPEDRFQSAAHMWDALGELEESSERGYSDQEPATVPADLDSPEEDPLTRDAPAENQEDLKQSPSTSIAPWVSSWPRRVAAVGVVLVLLIGAWFLAFGPSASSTEPTAMVERGGPTGDSSSEESVALEEDTTGNTRDTNTVGEDTTEGNTADQDTASTDAPPKGASGEEPTKGESSEETTSDTEPPGGQAPNDQSEQSTTEQPTEEATNERTAGADDERNPADSAATGGDTATSGTEDTVDSQKAPPQDLPSSIAALLDIEDPSVLNRRIDKLVDEGQLTRGEEPEFFFKPGQCFIFIIDREDDRVEAVLGPETDDIRVELRSGERLGDWESRYGNNIQIWTEPTNK